jgi:molybdopterin-containing oxidoreductase family membrane subunit
VVSLHRDFLPVELGRVQRHRVGLGLYLGTMGLFLTLFFLFIRYAMISISR